MTNPDDRAVRARGPHFVLYGRTYCHLCDDMLAALRASMARRGLPYTVDVVDVDADPALVARFDELVPVLFGDPAGLELCHYFFDDGALQRYLAGINAGTFALSSND